MSQNSLRTLLVYQLPIMENSQLFDTTHKSQLNNKLHKKRLTKDQVKLLESSFLSNNKLDSDNKSRLSEQLGLPPRQIAIWYQNRRARSKSQSLEIDHRALQLRLENVLAENARLQGRVECLKQELSKAYEVIHTLDSSFSSSCNGEAVGSSAGLGRDHEGKGYDELGNKEFYGSLFGDHRFGASDDGYDFFASSSMS